MASTAQQRIMEMDQVNSNLLNRIVRLKLADGIKYKTVRDYLIEDYHNNNEFDANKLEPLLVARANQTENNYKESLNQLIETDLKDSKYSDMVMKDPTTSLSFIDWLKGLSIGSISFEDKTIPWGPNRISIEEAYNKFTDITNTYDDQMRMDIEQEYLEQNREIIYYMFLDKAEEKGLKEDEIKMLLQNSQIINYLFNELIEKSADFENELANGTIEKKVIETITRNYIASTDKTEVEKMEQAIESPVAQMEEIQVDPYGPSIRSTEMLNNAEIGALATGLSYSEQKKVEQIRMDNGPEDEEDVDLDGTTETEVQLNESQVKIRG